MFVGVGTVVGAIGSLGPEATSGAMKSIYMMCMMMNFDVQTLQPGCPVKESYFIEIWKQNMCYPSHMLVLASMVCWV